MTEPLSILITGASRGIGRATAMALAAPGVRLALSARSSGLLDAVRAEAEALGAEAIALPADATDAGAVADMVRAAAGPAGRIDVLVHSVGAALVRPFEEITLGEWEGALRSQLTSLFLVCQAVAPRMGPGGLIVNLGSVAARQAFPGWSAYCAAKHGALGFAAAIREELRPRGIRVTSVLPAATDTALWDGVPGEWGRQNMLRPEDVAAAIAALVAHPPHVTVEELTIGHVAGRL
ncbi:SDR family NAD(P)-dependent oxidoreductase [Chloroflexales bacterium ZM16-3]|nr:SDR family NAD(P)-dependent oxidoreductase [Chloroflexales bacterium ZM16-3]